VSAVELATLPVATAQVECHEQPHTIRWEAGELTAVDHGDPEGERALAALGGTRLACIDVLNAWARYRRDPRLLTVCTRGPGDHVTPSPVGPGVVVAPGAPHSAPMARPWLATRPRPPRGGGSGGWRGTVSTARMTVAGQAHTSLVPGSAVGGGGFALYGHAAAEEEVPEGLALLAGLGGQVPLRLVATVTAYLLGQLDNDAGPAPNPGESPGPGAARPSLEASLFGRARLALAQWLDNPQLDIDVEVAEAGEPASFSHIEGPPLLARLPLSWVAEVWGRGLAVVAGRFAVGLLEATPHKTVLATIGPGLDQPGRVTIEVG